MKDIAGVILKTIDYLLKTFENYVAITVMLMITVVIFFSAIEVGHLIVIYLFLPPVFVLEVNEFWKYSGNFYWFSLVWSFWRRSIHVTKIEPYALR